MKKNEPVDRLKVYCSDCNKVVTVDGCDRPGCGWAVDKKIEKQKD